MLVRYKVDKKTFNYIVYNADVLLFIILVSLKTLQYGKFINSSGYTLKHTSPPVLASTASIAAVAIFFRKLTRIKFLLLMDFIISFILFADTIYFIYFKDIISAAAIRNSFLLKDVGTSVFSVIRPQFFLYFLDLITFIPILKFYSKSQSVDCCIEKRTAIAFLVLSISVTLNVKYFEELTKEQPRLLSTMSNKIYIAKVLGNLNFHVIDTYKYISTHSGKSKLTEVRKKEIETFLASKSSKEVKMLKAVGRGKNLIVIQVEALQQFIINNKVNGEEITPNLNKFIKKSLYFDNFYYQVAEGNTSDAEFMVNNSLYPAASGAAYYRYSNVNYSSLPAKLKEVGYYTSVLHGNSEGFWNRNVMYKSMHFDDFYGESSFNMDERIGMGLSDESFLNQTLIKLDHFKKPFYSFLVTLSSHHPYKGNKNFDEFKVGQLEGSMLGDYLKSIHYADTQLGNFLNRLKEKGYWENSIIVIYGDHNAMPKQKDEEVFKFLGQEYIDDVAWLKQQKVPFLIHFPGDKNKGINHTLCGQMDVLPTLVNIFDLKETPCFGRDIMNRKDRFLIFRNGSLTDGNFVYIASSDTFYDMNTGSIITDREKLVKFKEEAMLQLGYSDDILDHNLIQSYSDEVFEN
jgi:phosphoglycerol transferase MdoB-like AlkP superfamily enzyme